MLALLLSSMLTLALNIQPAKTEPSTLTVTDERATMQEPINLASQEPPPTEWNQTYGGTNLDIATSVVQTSDGGYAITGYTKSFGAGGTDFWLVKTDSAGSVQWNKTYGGANDDVAFSGVQTVDGGYAIVGQSMSIGAGGYNFWLVKTDADGAIQWNQTYGGFYGDYAKSVVQTDDGGYAIAGYTYSYGAGGSDFWLVKTDSSGDMQWSRTYGGTSDEWTYSVVQTDDGGYAIAGYTMSFGAGGSDFWLVKTDSAGIMQWNQTYGGASRDIAYSVVQTSDGGYALVGDTGSFGAGGADFWLVKTDADGVMQWNQTYGGASGDMAKSLVQTDDGGYAIAGYTMSFGAGGSDFWLVKTNSAGNMEWNRTYGRAKEEGAFSVFQTGDGGYAIAGYTYSYGAGGSDFWLIKLASSVPTPIYIRADGSVTPADAPISTVDNVTYTFTDNIVDAAPLDNAIAIIIERDNIVLNGAGYTLQGTQAWLSRGIMLEGRSNVTIKNMTIKQFWYGVYLSDSSNFNTVYGNNITNNNFGVWLAYSSNFTIYGNNITNNNYGVLLSWSSYNTVYGNNITNNNFGVELSESSNNTVSGNVFVNDGLSVQSSYRNVVVDNTVNGKPLVYLEGVSDAVVEDAGQIILVNCNRITVENLNLSHTAIGVQLRNTNNTAISGNNITNNNYGVLLSWSSYNTVYGNNITANNWYGIWLVMSSYNTISGNNITNNGDGIYLTWSSFNTVSVNNVTANNWRGVYLYVYSSGNRFYHNNFIDNARQVYFYEAGYANIWDDGYPSGGNYWSDYEERYPDAEELAAGIWDTPYIIDADNQDRYPLMNPWTPIPPTPDFSITASPDSLTIQQGDSDTSVITITSIGGFNQSVQLTVSGAPSGVTTTLNPEQVTPPPDGSTTSTLTVSVDTTATPGSYILTVTGTNGTITRSVDISLEILTAPPLDEPPVCVVRLQKDGVEISEIDVGEFFDIYVGDSTDDTGIAQVRFSSDDLQDDIPTGEWTEWYNWGVSSEDWNAETKIKRWAFATPGYKEVWAEVKDYVGQTVASSAYVFVPAPALPAIISPLVITPVKEIYTVGDTLTAEFTIKNIGDVPITLDVLTVGGRLNGWRVVDFTHQSVTLQPDMSYQYQGTLTLTQQGSYRFFVAYYVENPTQEEKTLLDENNWNTHVELGEGLTHTDRVKNIIVYEEGIVPEDVFQLNKTINRLIELGVEYPTYLLDPEEIGWVASIWMTVSSVWTDVQKEYDALYFAGVDYGYLKIKALLLARSQLEIGDIEGARKFLRMAYTFGEQSYRSFLAATELLDRNLEVAEDIARTVKDLCQAAVIAGVSVINPTAGKVLDYTFIITDYIINEKLVGKEQALRTAIRDAIVTTAFNEVPFFDGKTMSEYVKVDPALKFTELQRYIKNSKVLADDRFYDAIKEMGVEGAEELSKAISDALIRGIDYILEKALSPIELRVYDSKGRITGLIHGEIRHEIPTSFYYKGTITIFFPFDTYYYEVAGTETGTYRLDIVLVKEGETTTFTAIEIPTSANAIHQYTIDWEAISAGQEGVTIKVDSDGDGVFELTFISDSELTQDEFMQQVSPVEAFPMWIVGVAVAAVAIATAAIAVLWRRRKQPLTKG